MQCALLKDAGMNLAMYMNVFLVWLCLVIMAGDFDRSQREESRCLRYIAIQSLLWSAVSMLLSWHVRISSNRWVYETAVYAHKATMCLNIHMYVCYASIHMQMYGLQDPW